MNALNSESIFGNVAQEQAYNPPIEQSSVMSLESDLAVRPTVDDVNPSGSTVFSSTRTTTLLITKLSTADVKDYAVSTVETADQTVKSHVITEKTTFDADQQLVSKKYVDDNAGSAPGVPFTSSFIAQTGSNEEGKGLLSIGNTNAQASANRTPPTCKNSTFIGEGAADGIEATNANYGGDNATAVGYKAMGDLESGEHMSNTTAVGSFAGYQTRSIHTTMVGYEAGRNCRNQGATFVGMQAGKDTTNTTGFNTGVGAYACQGGNQRDTVAIGYRAASGGSGAKGSQNVMVGHDAGQGSSDSTHQGRNTFIGKSAGQSSYARRCIYIGNYTGKDQGTSAAPVEGELKIGTLLEGTLPSYAGGSAAGEFKINAPVVKLDTNLKTQADYASLDPGTIYCDTSDGNVLKMK